MDYTLTHLRLLVPLEKLADCFAFYRDVLGLETDYDGTGVYQELKAGAVILGLFPRDMMADVSGATVRAVTDDSEDTAVLCFAVDDVDKRFAQARDKGAVVVREPHDQPTWMLRIALLRDPAGNLIEINRDLPHDQA